MWSPAEPNHNLTGDQPARQGAPVIEFGLTRIISKSRLSQSRVFSILTFVYEMHRQIIEIICHSEYQT